MHVVGPARFGQEIVFFNVDGDRPRVQKAARQNPRPVRSSDSETTDASINTALTIRGDRFFSILQPAIEHLAADDVVSIGSFEMPRAALLLSLRQQGKQPAHIGDGRAAGGSAPGLARRLDCAARGAGLTRPQFCQACANKI
jgi:hypothetical protein